MTILLNKYRYIEVEVHIIINRFATNEKKIPIVDLKSVLSLYFYYHVSFLLLLKDKSVIEKSFVYFV